MQAVSYADPECPTSGKIYCDTSFILDLWTHLQVIEKRSGSASPSVRAKATAAREFYDRGRVSGLEFYTSVFGIEEAFNAVLTAPLRAAYRVWNVHGWKELRKKDKAAFDRSVKQGRRALAEFSIFYDGLEISPLFFGRTPDGGYVLETGVAADARVVLSRIHVDTMDAFHYATLRRHGFQMAVSSDGDWPSFPCKRTVVTLIAH